MKKDDSELIYEAYIAESIMRPGPENIEKMKTFFSIEDSNNSGYWNEVVMPAIEEYIQDRGRGHLNFPEGNPSDTAGLEDYLDSLIRRR